MIKTNDEIQKIIGYSTAKHLVELYGDSILQDIWREVSNEYIQTQYHFTTVDQDGVKVWHRKPGVYAVLFDEDIRTDPLIPLGYILDPSFLKDNVDARIYDCYGNYLTYQNGDYIQARLYGRGYIAPMARYRVVSTLHLFADTQFHHCFTRIVAYLNTYYQPKGIFNYENAGY